MSLIFLFSLTAISWDDLSRAILVAAATYNGYVEFEDSPDSSIEVENRYISEMKQYQGKEYLPAPRE